MTLYLEKPANTFNPWRGKRLDGVAYPLNIEELWSDAKLAQLGLYNPAPGEDVPEGFVSTGMTVQRVEGVIQYVHTTEVIPGSSDDPHADEHSLNRRQFRSWRRKVSRLTGFDALLKALLAADDPAYDDMEAMLEGGRFHFTMVIQLMTGFEAKVIELKPTFTVAAFEAVAGDIWIAASRNEVLRDNT